MQRLRRKEGLCPVFSPQGLHLKAQGRAAHPVRACRFPPSCRGAEPYHVSWGVPGNPVYTLSADAPMNLLVTAGNTLVPIDAVRCITNIFTGRTGASIARHAHERGHSVT